MPGKKPKLSKSAIAYADQVQDAIDELKSLGDEKKQSDHYQVIEVTKNNDLYAYNVKITNFIETYTIKVSNELIADSGLTPYVIAANKFEQENPGKLVFINPYIEEQFLAFGSAVSKNGMNPYNFMPKQYVFPEYKPSDNKKFKCPPESACPICYPPDWHIEASSTSSELKSIKWTEKPTMWDWDSLVTKSKKQVKSMTEHMTFKISDPDDLILL